jgi:hypothetical protein
MTIQYTLGARFLALPAFDFFVMAAVFSSKCEIDSTIEVVDGGG